LANKRTSVPGYCIPREIKLKYVSISPFLPPKTPQKGAQIGIFKSNSQKLKIKKIAYLRNYNADFNQIL